MRAPLVAPPVSTTPLLFGITHVVVCNELDDVTPARVMLRNAGKRGGQNAEFMIMNVNVDDGDVNLAPAPYVQAAPRWAAVV